MEGYLSWVIAIYDRDFLVSLSGGLDIDFFPLRGHVVNRFHKTVDRNVAGESAVGPQNSSIYDVAQLQIISNALSIDKSHLVPVSSDKESGLMREFTRILDPRGIIDRTSCGSKQAWFKDYQLVGILDLTFEEYFLLPTRRKLTTGAPLTLTPK